MSGNYPNRIDAQYRVVDVKIDSSINVDVKIDSSINMVPSMQIISGGSIPYYEGAYTVTPLAHNEVILETKNLRMRDDVTVERVPYYETTNESGGYTVYIGGQL